MLQKGAVCPGPPTGTVTFLFTTIEGSTRLLQRLGDRYAGVLVECRRLLRRAVRQREGQEVDVQGDGLLAAFDRARDAAGAAVAAQRALAAAGWPDGAAVRARMGLHTGGPARASGHDAGLDVHRAARVCAAAHGGQVLLSRTTHGVIERDLPAGCSLRDLGEHRLKDLPQPETLFQLLHPDLPGDFPPVRSLDTLSHNLPLQTTSFIGREHEIAEIKRLLSTSRVLTLTGSGGAGKTRLSLQAGADLLEVFDEGVWLVELAPLSDPTLVPHIVASTLGVREERGQTVIESLVSYLCSKSTLLLLDNCEHVIAAAAQLVDTLMRACPALRMLATSREPLGVAGEIVYRVPSLSWPHPQRLPSLDPMGRYAAVRLFLERAGLHQPGFALTEVNAPAIAQLCHRLDGMPLAIELAAARVPVLSVEQIAARLDDRFRLLTSGARTSLGRHQTLRAAIDWSHDLLSEQERVLLRRVSVFAGGFALEAAEAVCAGHGVPKGEVLDVLTQLVNKSLVAVETYPGEARYRLQETVHQYSGQKLAEAGEDGESRARHRSWYLRLAERAEPELQGTEQRVWLRRLETDHDNLRAALASAIQDEAEAALRLAGALWWFWHVRGYMSEGRAWLSKALAGSATAPSRARAKALCGAGFLAWRQAEFERAEVLGLEGLTLYRALGDRSGMASAFSLLEHVARSQGDHARAAAQAEESLALFRELGDMWGIAASLMALGNAARLEGNHVRAESLLKESVGLYEQLADSSGRAAALHFLGLAARDQGDYARAEAVTRESLRLARDLGDTSRIAFSLHSLGLVARDRNDLAQAEALFAESLTLFRELEDTWGVTTALVSLAVVAQRQGDDARAAALLQESLALRNGLGDRPGIAECLEGLAGVALRQNQLERAARYLGAVEALRQLLNAQVLSAYQADHDRAVSTVRKRLGKKAFETACAAGRHMSMDSMLEDALKPIGAELGRTGTAHGAPSAAGRTTVPSSSLLTRREQEVAALISQGRTNREIAGELVITEGTVANHVQHILNKLGLHSRAQIAVWAVEHGIRARHGRPSVGQRA